jgi:predicted phosphodiesterase
MRPPVVNDGSGISPHTNAAEMASLLRDCDAELVCVGHTHCPFELRAGGVHVVNPGTVSLSVTEDKSARYVLLDAGENAYSVQHYSVPYDRAKVIEQLNRMRLPGRGYPIKHLSGR